MTQAQQNVTKLRAACASVDEQEQAPPPSEKPKAVDPIRPAHPIDTEALSAALGNAEKEAKRSLEHFIRQSEKQIAELEDRKALSRVAMDVKLEAIASERESLTRQYDDAVELHRSDEEQCDAQIAESRKRIEEETEKTKKVVSAMEVARETLAKPVNEQAEEAA